MKKKTAIITAFVAALLLSACGGSNGDNTDSTIKPDNNNIPTPPGGTNPNATPNNPQPNNPQPNNPQTNNNSLQPGGGDFGKGSLTVSLDRNRLEFTDRKIIGGDRLTLRLEGERDPIKLPSFAADEHKGGLLIYNNTAGREGLSYRNFVVSDNSYRYTQIGAFTEKDGRGLFSRGIHTPTANIPTSGSATYRGDSILNFYTVKFDVDTVKTSFIYNRTEQGQVKVDANFADKTFNMEMKSPTYKQDVVGKIEKSEIVSPLPRTYDRDYGGVAGHFTGPNAEEMYGFYGASRISTQKVEYIEGEFAAKR